MNYSEYHCFHAVTNVRIFKIKMNVRCWGQTIDGSIEIVSLSQTTLKDGMQLFKDVFLSEEKCCVAVELPKYPEAYAELDELFLKGAKDGVSVVAIEKATQKVVGIEINKLHVRNQCSKTYLQEYAKRCKHDSSKGLVQSMYETDLAFDVFKIADAECMLETMGTAVLPDFRFKKIARKLLEATIDLVKALEMGENVKVAVDGINLPIDPIPTAIFGTSTSAATKIASLDLGFKAVFEISYENFMYKGKSFASRLGFVDPCMTIVYFPLKNNA